MPTPHPIRDPWTNVSRISGRVGIGLAEGRSHGLNPVRRRQVRPVDDPAPALPVVISSAAKGGDNPVLSGFTAAEAGDLLFLVVAVDPGSITTPAGFTQYGPDITLIGYLYRMFTKTAAGGETSVAVTASAPFARVVAGLVVVRDGAILDESAVSSNAGSPTSIPSGAGYSTGQVALAVTLVRGGTADGRVQSYPAPFTDQVLASPSATGTAGVQSGNGKLSIGIGSWTADAADSPTGSQAATGTVNEMNIRTLRIG